MEAQILPRRGREGNKATERKLGSTPEMAEGEEPATQAEKEAREAGGGPSTPVMEKKGEENSRKEGHQDSRRRAGDSDQTKKQTTLWTREAGMTITFLSAKEGKAQGDVAIALGVRAPDVPADTFIQPAIIPDQEAVRQGNTGLEAGTGHIPERGTTYQEVPKGEELKPCSLTGTAWTRPKGWRD